MTQDTILAELIESSGHELQASLTPVFETAGWIGTPSKYYVDVLTGKAREIDVILEKTYQVSDTFGRQTTTFAIRLFAACKYFPETYLLRLEPKREAVTKAQIVNQGILREDDLIAYPDRKHHYLLAANDKVVKSWDKKSQRDLMFEATTSSVHALVALDRMDSSAPHVINYPVVLVDSFKNLFIRDAKAEKGFTPVTENIQLEFDYTYRDSKGREQEQVFTVDVVAKDSIPAFLEAIENDAWLIRNRLHWDLEMADRQPDHGSGLDDYI